MHQPSFVLMLQARVVWCPGKIVRKQCPHAWLACAGFMGTGAAVIRKSDQGLEGLILEKVNGAPLEKR